MNPDIEQQLYGLLEIADTQQQAIADALALLQKRNGELARLTALLLTTTQALTPAVENAARCAARDAVTAVLAAPGASTEQALQQAAQPAFAGLQRIGQQIAAVEQRAQTVLQGFNRRWAWLAGITAGAALLSLTVLAHGVLSWERHQLEELRHEREQLETEVEGAQQTLALLTAKTGGVRYQRTERGRFLLLPQGYDSRWQCDGGRTPCIRLN